MATYHNLKLYIILGSISFIGSDNIPDGGTATEADWTAPDKCSPYIKSKTLGEKAAWDLIAQQSGKSERLIAHCVVGYINY